MAARKTKGTADKPWSDMTRRKIQTSMLLKRLTDHVLGVVDLTATQVRAAEILINRTLPNLSAVDITGQIERTDTREMTDAELSAIAAAGREGTAGAEEGEEQPPSIH